MNYVMNPVLIHIYTSLSKYVYLNTYEIMPNKAKAKATSS